MKWMILHLLLFSIFGCSSHQDQFPSDGLLISEKNPDKWTYMTQQNLRQLEQVYDLKPFIFTRTINIDGQDTNHSHPVLTLNTRHAEAPTQLLASWLHEEFHWWSESNAAKLAPAFLELKKIYPTTNQMTQAHLFICYLEYRALDYYLGKKEAKKTILDKIKKDKSLAWSYGQALTRERNIKKILDQYQLLPSPLD